MSTGFAFSAGWQDRLRNIAPQLKLTMHKRAAVSYAYERGRHTAALYLMDMSRQRASINNAGPFVLPFMISFKSAYRVMSPELKALINAERKFVRQPKRKSVLDNLSNPGR